MMAKVKLEVAQSGNVVMVDSGQRGVGVAEGRVARGKAGPFLGSTGSCRAFAEKGESTNAGGRTWMKGEGSDHTMGEEWMERDG